VLRTLVPSCKTLLLQPGPQELLDSREVVVVIIANIVAAVDSIGLIMGGGVHGTGMCTEPGYARNRDVHGVGKMARLTLEVGRKNESTKISP